MSENAFYPGFLSSKVCVDLLHAGRELRLLEVFASDHLLLKISAKEDIDLGAIFLDDDVNG